MFAAKDAGRRGEIMAERSRRFLHGEAIGLVEREEGAVGDFVLEL